jgi:hypothetical protein
VTNEPSRRRPTPWRRHLLPGLTLAAAPIALLWPLVTAPAVVPDMDDAFFNVWRLAWIAHQLVHDPIHLFDANIFHPATSTLAYSDALLLVGLAGAPFIWAGLPPAVVHNGLVLAAFATSGWGMYALALRLSGGDRLAATVAGLVVVLAPYRFAHIAHLELQWLVWMPLALVALHRLVERPRLGAGLALGACLAAQLLCSIYYGVFLCLFVAVGWVAFVAAVRPRPGLAAATAAAALPLAVVAAAYLQPYAASRGAHPARTAAEVAEYSAVPSDYLRAPSLDALRGRADTGPAHEERTLYPGTIAVVLAVAGVVIRRRDRLTWAYVALVVVAADASLGVHGLTFRALQAMAPPLGNLRAPARFASLGLVALAGLAAMGAAGAAARLGRHGWIAGLAAIAIVVGEASFRPLPTRPAPLSPMPVDAWLRTLPADTVILELPVPAPHRLWRFETSHQVRSIHHWRRLVNGYSGFLPDTYANTLVDMQTFPDERSIARLRRLSVDFVIVRRINFPDDDAYARATTPLLGDRAFAAPQVLGRGLEEAAAFPLMPAPP